ncbi:hypothetical protein [Paenibacillus solani]|uniref:hypothetical protein n=1 Tax=Paenibacillus solani TaxID=1705565 RepID=UPI003D28AF69
MDTGTLYERTERTKKMNNEVLDIFGEFLMEELRDKIIERFEMINAGLLKSPSTQRLIQDYNQFNKDQREIIQRVLINSIDSGIHDFLFKIQEEQDMNKRIKIKVNDIDIAVESDGLHGELFTEDGWIQKYSKYEGNTR